MIQDLRHLGLNRGKRKNYKVSEEGKQHMKDSRKKFFDNMTPEERKSYFDKLNTPEIRLKKSMSRKKKLENLTPEEKKKMTEKANLSSQKEYFTYILKCCDDTLYTGSTKNLEERFSQHNSGNGAKYTKCRCPLLIVYSEKFPSRSLAMKREREIKKLSKQQKLDLIQSKNPNP